MAELPRIVITGIGLTSPNGNSLTEYRRNLLAGKSGVRAWSIRHIGDTLAGVCDYDALRWQKKKELRRGTRAGSIGSSLSGMPVATLQKEQARVQVAPRIIKVACFCFQHSPIFGQAASSHTVARLRLRISLRVS